MPNELKIGFIGGCSLAQRNITKDKRFFEIFRASLQSKKHLDPSFNFSSYVHFHQLENAFNKISKKQKNDFLIVHIRPQPFLTLSKLLIKKKGENSNTYIYINPILLKKGKHVRTPNNPEVDFNPLIAKPTFASLNIFLGRIFQINLKASQQILDTLQKIHAKCAENSVQLFVLGIPPQLITREGNKCCKKFNQFLLKKCLDNGIVYIDTFDKMNSNSYFLEDKVHLSEKGHECLGNLLYDGMYEFILLNSSKMKENT